jgi:hypothetical protein
MPSQRLHFIFPEQPFVSSKVDEMFSAEAHAFADAGFTYSTISIEALEQSVIRIKPALPSQRTIVYRGWMLTQMQYQNLARAVAIADSTMLTSPVDYLASHHIPNWYPQIADFTPETRFYDVDANFELELSRLAWSGYFVKDFVKSLKTTRSSQIHSPEEIKALVAEMRHFRGLIEGGIAIRRLENLQSKTEQRYFVLYQISEVRKNFPTNGSRKNTVFDRYEAIRVFCGMRSI